MDIRNTSVKTIDDYYEIAENALDAKERDRELIITDAVGQSMRPTILSGDRIVIDSAGTAGLKIGDIIAFRKGGLLICHRIKEIKDRDGQKFFVTIGDSHDDPDRFETAENEIAGQVVRVIRRGFSSRLSFYSRWALKGRFEFFGVYYLAKEFFFKLARPRLEYRLSLPRKRDKHLAYKYVEIVLSDISGRAKEFFAPLDHIGGFRMAVYFGNKIAASAEVHKCPEKEKPGHFWAVTGFYASELFSRTALEADVLKACRLILDKIDVRDLRFREPAGQPRLTYPFISLYRAVLAYLQHSPSYRGLAGKLFSRRVKFSLQDNTPADRTYRSYRFLASWGRQLIGSVSLVERKTEQASAWWVYSLQVSRALRGAGIGETLMRRLIDFARSQGGRRLRLDVSPDKKAAIKLYKKLGFVGTGRYDHGLMNMELDL